MKVLLFFLTFAAAALPVFAEDVLFVRNNWKHRLYVMANGEWQGYVDPGKVAYMPQEGFVTEESGFQADGSLKVEHSYGGWPVTAQFEIAGVSTVFEEDGAKKVFYSKGARPYLLGYKQWGFGYGADGEISVPSSLDTESAEKMRRGRPPQEALDLLGKGLTPVKTANGGGLKGLFGEEGVSFPLLRSGGGEKETASFTGVISTTKTAAGNREASATITEKEGSLSLSCGIHKILGSRVGDSVIFKSNDGYTWTAKKINNSSYEITITWKKDELINGTHFDLGNGDGVYYKSKIILKRDS